VAALFVCQALLLTCNSLLIATSALVGLSLAPQPELSTVPLAVQFLAVMLVTYPASMLMRRFGRRAGLVLGALLGTLGGAACTMAIVEGHFALFCLGSAFMGTFSAFGQYFRFAAADAAPPQQRGRAIALVMAGGVLAAFLGPNLARFTRESVAGAAFAGSYFSIIALSLACAAVLGLVRIPRPDLAAGGQGRSALALLAQPVFIVAVAAAVVAYGSMNLVMTSTPLAMDLAGFAFDDTANVIQWHVVGMFAPSFFTGHLIERIGILRIMMAGALLMLACVGVNHAGTEVAHFWTALVLLGIGWNFLFVGATTLLTHSYRPAEKARAQGLNDLVVFSTVALSALVSGAAQAALGFSMVNLITVPGLVLVMGALLWLQRRAPVLAFS
jgi:predicted MFS family arabinose efflux permease